MFDFISRGLVILGMMVALPTCALLNNGVNALLPIEEKFEVSGAKEKLEDAKVSFGFQEAKTFASGDFVQLSFEEFRDVVLAAPETNCVNSLTLLEGHYVEDYSAANYRGCSDDILKARKNLNRNFKSMTPKEFKQLLDTLSRKHSLTNLERSNLALVSFLESRVCGKPVGEVHATARGCTMIMTSVHSEAVVAKYGAQGTIDITIDPYKNLEFALVDLMRSTPSNPLRHWEADENMRKWLKAGSQERHRARAYFKDYVAVYTRR